jgi:hypothetical protein
MVDAVQFTHLGTLTANKALAVNPRQGAYIFD